jgi:hypothetical protein
MSSVLANQSGGLSAMPQTKAQPMAGTRQSVSTGFVETFDRTLGGFTDIERRKMYQEAN